MWPSGSHSVGQLPTLVATAGGGAATSGAFSAAAAAASTSRSNRRAGRRTLLLLAAVALVGGFFALVLFLHVHEIGSLHEVTPPPVTNAREGPSSAATVLASVDAEPSSARRAPTEAHAPRTAATPIEIDSHAARREEAPLDAFKEPLFAGSIDDVPRAFAAGVPGGVPPPFTPPLPRIPAADANPLSSSFSAVHAKRAASPGDSCEDRTPVFSWLTPVQTAADGFHPEPMRFLLTVECPGRAVVHSGVARGVGNFTYQREYTAPLEVQRTDLVIVSCEFGKTTHLNYHYRSYVDPSLLRDVAFRMAKLDYEKQPGLRGLNVVVLQIDALSRAHFLRALKRSNALLRELDASPESEYRVFNFTKYNVVGYDSAENFPTMYGGFGFSTHRQQYTHVSKAGRDAGLWHWPVSPDDDVSQSHTDASTGVLSPPDTWVWPHYERQGYLTAHGDELCTPRQTVHKFFPTDRKPSMLRIGDAYCMPQYCCCCTREPRLCLGRRTSYRRSLEHLLELQQNYDRVGLLVTMNLLIAHEPSMRQVYGLDEPLVDYLRAALLGEPHPHVPLKARWNPQPRTVLMILSDHGLQYGEYSATHRGQREHKNPPLMLVMPRWLLDRYPVMHESLRVNQNRFVTAYDIYSTLMHLPSYPLPVEAPIWSYNLLRDEVPVDRSCSEAKVPPGYCVSQRWTEVQLDGLDAFLSSPERVLVPDLPPRPPNGTAPSEADAALTAAALDAPLLVLLGREAVRYVNTATAKSRPEFPRVCLPLSLVRIVKAQRSVLRGQQRARDMVYKGELRFDQFRVQLGAVATEDVRAYLALPPGPQRDAMQVTFEASFTLPPDPDSQSDDDSSLVFDSDTLEIEGINRISERAKHEVCAKPRDPRIADKYCVCRI